MPKRVIDFDALWASDKLASCAEWAQSEYAWLYGLADASGSFEMTNLRVIWGRVAAIRKNLTLERLQEIFDEFIARGLLFTWEENGKRYGHWTGSDVPGRLPAPSWRVRLEKLAPPVPREGLATYSARFGGSKEGIVSRAGAHTTSFGAASSSLTRRAPLTGDTGATAGGTLRRSTNPKLRGGSPAQQVGVGDPGFADVSAVLRPAALPDAQTPELKDEFEAAQGQDWDLSLDLEKDLDWEKEVSPSQRTQNQRVPVSSSAPISDQAADQNLQRRGKATPEGLLEIYEEERGALPPAGVVTPARRRRCARWLAAGFTPEEFRAAVRVAAATPFLAGDGDRGWKASFDWLIANRSNVRKVLAGEYAPHPSALPSKLAASRASGWSRESKSGAERRGPADLYTGMAPRPADCGVRVNPAALERIRARQARQAQIAASERVAAAPAELAPCAMSCGASDANAACAGFPPQAAGFKAQQEWRMSEAANSAPKPIAADAEPRAAPLRLKF